MTIHEDAPVVTRDQILIHAPIERIWAIQTDINAWPQWQSDLPTAHAESPLAPGSLFHWQTAGLDITSTVVAINPPHRIEWGGPANGITAVHVWEFETTVDGTIVRTEESWEGPPIDAAIDAMQNALDASLAEWLRRLKHRAETSE